MYLRFAAAIVALAAAAAGIVVAVTLVRSVPGPTSTTASSSPATPAAPVAPAPTGIAGGRIPTPTEPGFPSPPPGAVVLAQEAGTRALAVAVKGKLVRVSVLAPAGGGAGGLEVTVQPGGGSAVAAKPCGRGCYQTRIGRTPRSLSVQLAGKSYAFELPALPAPSAAAIVAHATDTWKGLRTVVWHERLGSSPTNVLHTVYSAEAPHSLAYRIAGGSAAVIIGGMRWDRPTPSAPWQQSAQDPPLDQPQPFWQQATDAHLLGTTRMRGRRAWRVSFFDPSTPAWFEATIDRGSYHTLELDMTAAAHFMHHVYGPFNAPFHLVPPT